MSWVTTLRKFVGQATPLAGWASYTVQSTSEGSSMDRLVLCAKEENPYLPGFPPLLFHLLSSLCHIPR